MKQWELSLEKSRQYKLPFEEGWAHYEIGLHLPKNHVERDVHLAQVLNHESLHYKSNAFPIQLYQ